MKTIKWILRTICALFFSVSLGVLGACELPDSHAVKYEVTGSATSVYVTYEKGGDTYKPIEVSVPWDLSYSAESGDDVYIAAMNKGESATVTVTIYDNDSVFDTSTASGAYATAKASGTLHGYHHSDYHSNWGYYKVICAELHRQGLMDEKIFKADEEFGRYLYSNQRDVLMGYQLWARPVVKWMQESRTVTRIVASIATPWSYEMAYRMGAKEKGSFVGKLLLDVGVPVCRTIGRAMILAGNAGRATGQNRGCRANRSGTVMRRQGGENALQPRHKRETRHLCHFWQTGV